MVAQHASFYYSGHIFCFTLLLLAVSTYQTALHTFSPCILLHKTYIMDKNYYSIDVFGKILLFVQSTEAQRLHKILKKENSNFLPFPVCARTFANSIINLGTNGTERILFYWEGTQKYRLLSVCA